MPKKKDTERFLPLKTQWFHIMLSVAGEGQHGYGIMQEVLERTGGKVRLWPATLYGSLKRLMEAELIGESNAAAGPGLGRCAPALLPAHTLRPEGAQCRVRTIGRIGSRHSG